ncbi:hypothetical protein BM477_04820 [Boudabousia marimammalium]|uniref:Transcription regulator BetR N-terminal domain-containing protein n=2 Tax=Boudabousia marimammalium TaxID=156892 RepID=A0A1Q5PP50_9ACTO|nr:hypothetical protein BM477_04820 [Boudabousia marimammalium]
MGKINTLVTSRVNDWLESTGVRQVALGQSLGISQPQISRRLKGQISWTLGDVEKLAELGALSTPLIDEGDDE